MGSVYQFLVILTTLGMSLAVNVGCSLVDSPSASEGIASSGMIIDSPGSTVTVYPREIDDVLYNPGMGFADFHFGFGNPPPPDQIPRQTVAYFRWPWAELEPAEGKYNFAFVDNIIAQARAKGETLAFRILAETGAGSPPWLLDKGVASVKETDGIFPDYNNPIFLKYHEKLIRAFGERYSGSPDIDHVDIGSVGCWGEWNTACCQGTEAQCKQYYPTEANQIAITDWYLKYFPDTPLVMLVGGQLEYAVARGAGWRGDCFGDYGFFGSDWNHMDHVYEPAAQHPVVGNAWKTAPVQFEACGVMQDWYDKGLDIDLILQKGLEWHMSVFNGGAAPVPAAWRPRVDEFLKQIGYRFVLRELTHSAQLPPGGTLHLHSVWENIGVAPMYHPWPLGYRLRSGTDQVVAHWTSGADLQQWLPGSHHDVADTVTLPNDLPAGTYSLDVAVLTKNGTSAHVDLAIEGKRADRWYPVSQLIVRQ